MIIENKIMYPKSYLNSLDLNFCSGNNGTNDLNFYNNYNTAIICFIYNFFVVLELNKKVSQLSSLSILMDDLTDEKEYIIKNIKNKIQYYRDIKCFNLNNVKLNNNINNDDINIINDEIENMNINEIIQQNQNEIINNNEIPILQENREEDYLYSNLNIGNLNNIIIFNYFYFLKNIIIFN